MFVNDELGLTAAGYTLCIIFGIVLFLFSSFLAGKFSTKKKIGARQLAFCALALALSFVTSYVKLFSMPWGGAVTLCSMLFIVLVANWYGPICGIMIGFVYGIMQFMQEPYVLSLFQVCCDYVFAFAALGSAGLFRNKKNGLLCGYIEAIMLRGIFHSLGGYLYWMDYMPENFPKVLAAVYPICYNFSYILAEGIITIILLCIPAVKNAIERVGDLAKV